MYFSVGELKCQLCWTQNALMAVDNGVECKAKREPVEEWDVEDEYSYFCPFCAKLTQWNNKGNSTS